MDLEGKNAIVTGGSLGIGTAIAIKLAEEGANVAINYRKHDKEANEVAEKIRATDDTFGKIKAFLSDQQIVDLTTTIGYYGMVSRILESLQIELEA